MQINQPFELVVGIFALAVGVLIFGVGLYRMWNPMPRIKGWWLVAEAPMLWLIGLARISGAFDLFGHPSRRTLLADVAALLAGLLVIAFILPSARAVRQASRQGRDNPAV